jgi:hypothetical protein
MVDETVENVPYITTARSKIKCPALLLSVTETCMNGQKLPASPANGLSESNSVSLEGASIYFAKQHVLQHGSKAISVTGRGGRQDCEMLRITRRP